MNYLNVLQMLLGGISISEPEKLLHITPVKSAEPKARVQRARATNGSEGVFVGELFEGGRRYIVF
jgi:hypothetical protein